MSNARTIANFKPGTLGSLATKNAVGSADITDGSIATADIAAGAIITDDLADNAVTSGKIADSAVTSGKIADNAVTPSKLSQRLTLGTAQATTSGANREFLNIPSWVTRVTLLLDSVSTNGSSIPIIQLGTSGGFETSGYVGANGGNAGAAGAGGATPSSGHGLTLGGGATFVYTGIVTITRVTGNTWIITNMNTYSTSNSMAYGASVKTLGGTLDRVRINTVNGTDAFDAGSINILYE